MRSPLRRRSITIASVVIALITLLVAIGAGCVDSFVMHPTADAIDAGTARRIPIDAPPFGVVEAWASRSFADAGPPDAYVLAFTGNEQRAERLTAYNAERWSPHRVEAWTVNFPGYGGSSGPARLKAIAPTALAAYDALAKVADVRPIYVTSNSLGGTAAMHVAAHRPVAGLIVQNPPALREVIMGQGWWNLWLLSYPASLRVPEDLEAPDSARLVTAPAIFITAESDNLVIPKYQELTIDAFAGPKRRLILKHKGHNDTIDSPEEWQAFRADLDWLWTQQRR